MSDKGVLVLGDSHAKFFFKFGSHDTHLSDGTKVHGKSIGAASLAGFGRSRSALNLNTTVKTQIARFSGQCQHVVFAFGQVDVELGLYYRWAVKGEDTPPEILFEQIIARYFEMIPTLAGGLRPIVKGVNQTVLQGPHALAYTSRIVLEAPSHEGKPEKRMQALAACYPDFTTRQAISRQFNRILAKAAARAGIGYFDINSAIVDKKTGEVLDEYCPNFDDHHIVNSIGVHKLHLAHLKEAIGGSQP